jgi:hypothetical protein
LLLEKLLRPNYLSCRGTRSKGIKEATILIQAKEGMEKSKEERIFSLRNEKTTKRFQSNCFFLIKERKT